MYHANLVTDLVLKYTKLFEEGEGRSTEMKGLSVVISQKFRERLLNEIHEEHPGMCRMKALARS